MDNWKVQLSLKTLISHSRDSHESYLLLFASELSKAPVHFVTLGAVGSRRNAQSNMNPPDESPDGWRKGPDGDRSSPNNFSFSFFCSQHDVNVFAPAQCAFSPQQQKQRGQARAEVSKIESQMGLSSS